MNFEALKNYLDNNCYNRDVKVKNCQCRVMYKDKVVFDYHGGEDYSDDRNHYYMYSMTKPTTSVTLMVLVEKGFIKLEDEVSKYIPEFKDIKYRNGDEILPSPKAMTIYDLVTMQAGYDYVMDTPELEEIYGKDATNMDVAKALAKKVLNFIPGEQFTYSLCYDVLPAVMEVATGMPYGEIINKYLFEPLGMTETTFIPTEEEKKHIAKHYSFNEGIRQEIESNIRYRFGSNKYEGGGAGLVSCMDDYMKFAYMITNRGTGLNGAVIVSPETIALMRKNHMVHPETYPRANIGYDYGFGFRVLEHNDACEAAVTPGSFEITGAAGSWGSFNPEEGITVVYIQHEVGFPYSYSEIHFKVRDLTYQCLGYTK